MTSQNHPVSALVMAGRRPDGDALAEANGQRYKALLDVSGRPMIQHVLSALIESKRVERITVYTQEPTELSAAVEACARDGIALQTATSQGSIAGTVLQHLQTRSSEGPFLVTTADNPMLTAHAVQDFLDATGPEVDLAVGVVSQKAVDALPIQTKRTWLRFSDEAVTGCNLFLLKSERVRGLVEFWRGLEQQRKKVNHLARKLGLLFLLRYKFGWLSLAKAFAHISRKFDLRAGAVVLTDGHLAIDADHQADLEAIRVLKSQADNVSG